MGQTFSGQIKEIDSNSIIVNPGDDIQAAYDYLKSSARNRV